MTSPILKAVNLGRLSYRSALNVQQKHSKRILQALDGNSCGAHQENVLFLVEHDPVYTIGIRDNRYNKADVVRLKSLGAEFFKTDRGGLITFHGPGQLVAYPVIYLKDFKLTMKSYIYSLEQILISTCHHFGVESNTTEDTGVWIGNNKIAAIGVHGSRFVVTHGLALNCNTDLSWFSHIVPCGLEGKGVTSLSKQLGRNVTLTEATQPLLDCFSKQFDCEVKSESNVSFLHGVNYKTYLYGEI